MDAEEFFGVPSGHLTKPGLVQAARLGRQRFIEYHYNKDAVIAWKYNQNAFLSLAQPQSASTIMGERLI